MPTDWNQLVDAEISSSGEKFTCGDYKLKLVKLEEVKGGHNGDFLVEIFQVLESNSPVHAVGSEVVNLENTSGQWGRLAMGRIKSMLYAVCGIEKDSPHAPQVNAALPGFVADCSQIAGRTCRATVRGGVSKEGRPFRKNYVRGVVTPRGVVTRADTDRRRGAGCRDRFASAGTTAIRASAGTTAIRASAGTTAIRASAGTTAIRASAGTTASIPGPIL